METLPLDLLPTMQMVALGVNALLVLFIFPLRKSIENLQKSDDRMSSRLQNLEVKIAEKYVQRGEIHESMRDLNTKLERIESALVSRMNGIDRANHSGGNHG